MADTKITALTAITTVDPAVDVLPIVDVSDTTMAASGTTKKITSNQILGAGGTATLASATITGALTVGNGTSATQTFSGVTNILDIGYGSLRGGSAYGDVRLWTDRFRIYNNAGTQIIKNISGTNGDETWYDGAGGTRMTLNSTGLGVGGSPAAKLDVNGTVIIRDTFSLLMGFGNQQRILAGGTSDNTYLTFSQWTGAAYTERMRIDQSGNVGVGVTPSAWGNNFKVVQVGQAGAVYGSAPTGTYGTKFNLYNDNTNDIAITSNYVGEYRFDVLTGSHIWYNKATAGSVGVAQTLVPAMTLDRDGRLILRSLSTPATLTVNGQLTVNATSDTNLRFSYRGSDGVTRVANLTLA